MFVKVLVLLLATTQIAFAQERSIEGAFGVLFNTGVASVIEGLEGRYSKAEEYLSKQDDQPIQSYTITPPNPSKYLKDYRVRLTKRTQKVWLICGATQINEADTTKAHSISKDDALNLYNAFDKALTNKYGRGRNADIPMLALKEKRFVDSDNHLITLELSDSWGREELYNVEICYFDRVVGKDVKFVPNSLPDIIEIDDSPL